MDLFPYGFDQVPGNRKGDKRPEEDGAYAWRPCNSDPQVGTGFKFGDGQPCYRPFYPADKFMRTNIEFLGLAFKEPDHFFSSLVPTEEDKAYWKTLTIAELKEVTHVYFLPNVAQQSTHILLSITKGK